MQLTRSYNFWVGVGFLDIFGKRDGKLVVLDDLTGAEDNCILGYLNKEDVKQAGGTPVKVRLSYTYPDSEDGLPRVYTFYTTLEKSKKLFVRSSIQMGCAHHERALLANNGILLGPTRLKAAEQLAELMSGERKVFRHNISLLINTL